MKSIEAYQEAGQELFDQLIRYGKRVPEETLKGFTFDGSPAEFYVDEFRFYQDTTETGPKQRPLMGFVHELTYSLVQFGVVERPKPEVLLKEIHVLDAAVVAAWFKYDYEEMPYPGLEDDVALRDESLRIAYSQLAEVQMINAGVQA